MTTAQDLATLEAAQNTADALLGTAATAAATAETQVAAGTPSEWASIATMFDIANAQKAMTAAGTAASALGVDIAPPPPPPPPPPSALVIGSYNGAGNVAGNAAFGAECGVTPGLYSDYLAGDSWVDCVGSAGAPPWVLGQLKGKIPAGQRFVLSVPFVSAGYSSVPAALAAYAAGGVAGWDNYFVTLAQNLIATGFSAASLRLFWEDDVFDFKSGDTTSAANYAALWKRAVTAMRSVAGQNFTFVWYYAPSYDAKTLAASFPGASFVDYISLDFYDQAWATGAGAPPYNGTAFTAAQEQWLWTNSYLPAQLNGLVAFAKAQGKPIAFGECGVINRSDNHGGLDDPTFVTMFLNWCKANGVAWISWFNFNSGGDSVLSHYPLSLAAFKAWVAAN